MTEKYRAGDLVLRTAEEEPEGVLVLKDDTDDSLQYLVKRGENDWVWEDEPFVQRGESFRSKSAWTEAAPVATCDYLTVYKLEAGYEELKDYATQDVQDTAAMAEAVFDSVNRPMHYNSHPSGVECITITEHMSYTLGNAIKYIWRADLKGDAIEDLRKARFYLDREISKRERNAE